MPIQVGALQHVILTVGDPDRSKRFYMNVLGFELLGEGDGQVYLTNGSMWLLLFQAPNEPLPGDRFDENRIGLQNIGFLVRNVHELREAERVLDAHHVPHGLIEDYGAGLGFYGLRLRDPDNIQVELNAPREH